jgi:sugar phosphate permease
MTHVRYRILGLLFGVSFINYLLRNNVSVAAPSIQNEFAFSHEQIGWIYFGFSLTYALFQVPGGVFGDRFGPRRAFTIVAVAWGAITAITGFVPMLAGATAGAALLGFIVARAAMGVTHAPMFPMAAATIANWFPPGHRALPNAFLSSGLALGQAATGPVVSTLIHFVGWRGSFMALAPLGLLVAYAWWLLARDTPREHRGTDEAERKFISQSPFQVPVAAVPWRSVFSRPDVLVLTASYFSMNFVFLFFSQWLYEYLIDERGFSALRGGWMYALPFVVGAVFASTGGWVCDALCRRVGPKWGCRMPAMIALFLVALLLLAGSRAPDAYVAVALLALCFGFTQFTEGTYWSATTYASEPHTAMATGVMNMGGNVPGFLAPVVGLVIDRFGWGPAFTLGAVFAVIAALLWLGVSLKPRELPATLNAR